VLLALAETWAGIALAYWTDWPTTFWIVLLSCLVYFLSIAIHRLPLRGASRSAPNPAV
jgi:zinc/manganese transport system permease protein